MQALDHDGDEELLAKDEAVRSFGDDRMLVEKFVQSPRHLEIQVVADAFGNVATFPERECSVQRRNQKVVEEAPSPFLSDKPALRAEMQREAAMLARSVGYESAGTVEMLVDGATGAFYFLEMNTRLQVEHPITEAVSGEDLVELMLLVADGQRLPDRLLGAGAAPCFVPIDGWAVEASVATASASYSSTTSTLPGHRRIFRAVSSTMTVFVASKPKAAPSWAQTLSRQRTVSQAWRRPASSSSGALNSAA